MITGNIRSGAAGNSINEKAQAIDSPITTAGASSEGGHVSQEKDRTGSAQAPQFGEVWQQIQSKYGGKPEKPREVKKTLGKDDFLRIMVTQMKNQDPTNPFKAEQMASEIAQFTSVEQLQNVNQNLTKMASQNKPLENMSMTNLIGKTVTIDRGRFPHIEGENDDLSFKLVKDAKNVSVAILDDAGEELFKKDLGSQKAGDVSFVWDGIKANTMHAKAGTYRFSVDAKDESGKGIEINSHVRSKVIGVSFEGADPVFLVGDARHQDKVTMKNIVRIEVEPTDVNPENASNISPQAQNQFLPPVQIPSVNTPASVTQPIQQREQAAIRPSIPQNIPPSIQMISESEKGFPNGLHE